MIPRTFQTSEAEKDRIAGMVLKLVTALVEQAPRPQPPLPAEPTSTGYLDPEVRPYVMKRSA